LNFLIEDLGNFNVAQRAAVTDFTDLSVLDGLSELGSGGVFELGGSDIGLLTEERQDFVIVGDGTGSQVTDQTAIALSGFGIVQGDEGQVVFSRPLSTTTTTAAQDSGSQNETLEEDNTSQEAEGSSRG